ncbi:MAG: helix-turn-helix domain-containing protein [Aliivibrio sp.]|nr:helix-turn-helix domain-containing protein [Aliivibrio sp.]
MYHSIIEQLSNGVSVRKTAAALGCNPSTVMRAKKRWELAKLGAGIA